MCHDTCAQTSSPNHTLTSHDNTRFKNHAMILTIHEKNAGIREFLPFKSTTYTLKINYIHMQGLVHAKPQA
jgi:hypothetical protein